MSVTKACLHVPSPSPSPSPSKYNIVPMVTVRLTGRMGTEPILSIKRFVSIDTLINFEVDGDGRGDRTCKQASSGTHFNRTSCHIDVHQKYSFLREKIALYSQGFVITELVVSGNQCTLKQNRPPP